MTEGDSMAVAGEAQSPVDAIHQCVDCQRQHDGRGTVTVFKFGLPVLVACGRSDCGTVAAALKLEESERIEGQKQRAWKPIFERRHSARMKKIEAERDKENPTRLKGGKHRAAPVTAARGFRSSCAPELARSPVKEDSRDPDPEPEAREAAPGTSQRDVPTSSGERQAEFVASGAGESARAVLFKFLNRDENWMRPFRSTFLEDYTREQGHGSSRMNNRARELREDFAPAGIYLDNDPNGSSVWCEGLPPGSYYRVCWTQDATSLTDQQKTEWLRKKKGQQPLV